MISNCLIKVSKYFFLIERENEVELAIRNNGTNLPTGFLIENYIKPGGIMGSTGHSGLGGYLIGLIVSNHGAKLNIKEADSPYTVEISIILPKT